MKEETTEKLRVMVISIGPPQNNHGVRIVLFRHLVARDPFEIFVATNARDFDETVAFTYIKLPRFIERVVNTRFGGARLAPLIRDFENFILSRLPNSSLNKAIDEFRPDVLLVLADNYLSKMAYRAARKKKLPMAGLFLDWFPIMKGYSGQRWTMRFLNKWYRQFYQKCDLAICTSDGMKEELGDHPNAHVVYPMPGNHQLPEFITEAKQSSEKFRLVYVGSVENFYGRMLCSLITAFDATTDLAITVIGPKADWPEDMLRHAREKNIYLGFKPPEEAASYLASADALLVVMSFEEEYELFMRTSFTTKFLDYVAYGKPVILWGPEYCTPSRVVRDHGGALCVTEDKPDLVVSACQKLASNAEMYAELSDGARRLHETLFNPDRLQDIFVSEIEKLVKK
jgi:glycosyltransferase involved in cell wall biosynthesis